MRKWGSRVTRVLATAFIWLWTITSATADRLSIVAVGHLYPLFESRHDDQKEELLSALFQTINSLKPDYVAVLGDSSLDEDGVVATFRAKLTSQVLFAPGNNDLDEKDGIESESLLNRKERYLDQVGYLEKIVKKNGVRLVIFNSQESTNYLNNFFNKALKTYESEKSSTVNVLLGHHRIWDDSIISAEPYQHDKSYYFDEIYPALKGRVSAIFAGNSKRQYFTDFEGLQGAVKPKWGKQNYNNIFWVDKVGDIAAYSIGTSEGTPKLGFVEIVVTEKNQIVVNPHFVSVEYEDPIPRKFIVPNGKTHPQDSPRDRFALGLSSGAASTILTLALFFLWRRKKIP